MYAQPANQDAEDYPLGFIDPSTQGLYRQLIWAVNQLSIGYYAYREGRLTEITFQRWQQRPPGPRFERRYRGPAVFLCSIV